MSDQSLLAQGVVGLSEFHFLRPTSEFIKKMAILGFYGFKYITNYIINTIQTYKCSRMLENVTGFSSI